MVQERVWLHLAYSITRINFGIPSAGPLSASNDREKTSESVQPAIGRGVLLTPSRIYLAYKHRGLTPRRIPGLIRFTLTAYRKRNLLASLPRSGYNYSALVLNVAQDIAHGGTGDYAYDGIAGGDWVPARQRVFPLDWRSPTFHHDEFFTDDPTWPVIFHTFNPYKRIRNLQKGKMKVAVLVRNIIPQLESRLLHARDYDPADMETFLKSPLVREPIDFYNSWGAFLETHPDSIVVHYEDIVEEPVREFMRLSELWGLQLTEEQVSQAVARCTREEMFKRIPPSEAPTNLRVSAKQARGEIFPPEAREFLIKSLEGLRYQLGYDYTGLLA